MSKITELPRGSCTLGGANAVVTSIDRVIPIFHSGPGCPMQTSAATYYQAGLRGPNSASGTSIPLSNMLEREVVFGGIDRLRGTIDGALEIYDADAFFVLTGCTSGIIGDDVEVLAAEYRENGAPVYAFDTPGFLGDDYRGYELAFDALLDKVIEEAPRQSNLVNLFGVFPYHDPFWEGTFAEFTRILNKLGLEVNTFFTNGQGIDVVRTASSAALNIVFSTWLLQPFARKFEERYGTPTLRWDGVPIGGGDTSAFVRAVGEALELDKALVEAVITEEETELYRLHETTIGAISWKRYAVVGNVQSAVPLTRYLANELSLTPVLTIITDPIFRDSDKAAIAKAVGELDYATGPELHYLSDQFDIDNLIREHPEITLIVGGSGERPIANEIDAQVLVAVFPIADRLIINRTYFGYRGSLTLMEDLFDNL